MNNLKKHDDTLDILVERLEDNKKYNNVCSKLEYHQSGCKDVCGEVDALAYRTNNHNSHLLLFEVKSRDCSKSYNKALKQLSRSAEFFADYAKTIHKFYVTPKGKELNIVKVK